MVYIIVLKYIYIKVKGIIIILLACMDLAEQKNRSNHKTCSKLELLWLCWESQKYSDLRPRTPPYSGSVVTTAHFAINSLSIILFSYTAGPLQEMPTSVLTESWILQLTSLLIQLNMK